MPFLGFSTQLQREAQGFPGSAVATGKRHRLRHRPAPVGEVGAPGSFPMPTLTNGTRVLGPVRLCFQVVHWPYFTPAGGGDFLLLEGVVLRGFPGSRVQQLVTVEVDLRSSSLHFLNYFH